MRAATAITSWRRCDDLFDADIEIHITPFIEQLSGMSLNKSKVDAINYYLNPTRGNLKLSTLAPMQSFRLISLDEKRLFTLHVTTTQINETSSYWSGSRHTARMITKIDMDIYEFHL